MKPPVHTVNRVQDHILVMRLQAPRFSAMYDTEENKLKNIRFDDNQPYPANAESLFNKAKAAVKQFLKQPVNARL